MQNCDTFSAEDRVCPANTSAFNRFGGGTGLKILFRSSSGNGSSPGMNEKNQLKIDSHKFHKNAPVR